MLQRYTPRQLTLAYSGGMDSQLLLHLLAPLCQSSAIILTAVHVHHGISRHADAWAGFCAEQCQALGVSFQLQRVTLTRRADIERQARDARYQALAGYVNTEDSALITAHHANDQLETMLLALKRGAGLQGLSGMAQCRPFAGGLLLRPWLHFSRQQLHEVALALQLPWVEDDSNSNPDFERNFLRLQVIPALSARWPTIATTSSRAAEHLQQALQLADYYTDQALAQCQQGEYLDLQQLALQPALQQDLLIRKWLAQAALNPSSQWLQTLKQQVLAARADAQPVLTLGDYQLRRFLQRLYLLPAAATLPVSGEWSLVLEQVLALPKAAGSLNWHKQATLGALPVAGQHWQLRFGALSQLFKPAGQLTKPLKQWLKLWQVPPWQRQQLPLLFSEGQLQWVAGYASAVSADQASGWLSWQRPEWRQPAFAAAQQVTDPQN